MNGIATSLRATVCLLCFFNGQLDRAILTWLKGTVETVAIDIKSKYDESGNRTWFINGRARISK